MKKLFTIICITLFLFTFLQSCDKEQIEPTPAAIPLNKQDSIAMVEIYNSTGGGTDWALTWDLTDFTTWTNVKVEEIDGEYRIVSIQIAETLLHSPNGTLPEAIGDFTQLKKLYIASEHLRGGLPKSIGKLSLLENLEICGTGISGTIPLEIGKLKHLKKLHLLFNNFSGELPEELGELPLNTIIWISHNSISGSVPLKLLAHQRHNVMLDYNNITELPWECWLNPNYGIPSIMYNRLSGNVPEEVQNTDKWREYSNCVSPQQDGYGYTYN